MEGNNNSCFGAEIIDKLDCNYLNLIAECISETSKRQQEVGSSCSVEVVGENCEVYKYYAETASIVVDRHFTRSLPTGKLTQPNMNMKAPEEKKGEMSRVFIVNTLFLLITSKSFCLVNIFLNFPLNMTFAHMLNKPI